MGTPKSRRGRKKTDSCAVLVALAGSLIGLGVFLSEAARWVA
jgi:hypothetical protein